MIYSVHFVHFSTISSGLNSLSAVTLQDIVRLFFFKEMSEARATNVSKIIGKQFIIWGGADFFFYFIEIHYTLPCRIQLIK